MNTYTKHCVHPAEVIDYSGEPQVHNTQGIYMHICIYTCRYIYVNTYTKYRVHRAELIDYLGHRYTFDYTKNIYTYIHIYIYTCIYM